MARTDRESSSSCRWRPILRSIILHDIDVDPEIGCVSGRACLRRKLALLNLGQAESLRRKGHS